MTWKLCLYIADEFSMSGKIHFSAAVEQIWAECGIKRINFRENIQNKYDVRPISCKCWEEYVILYRRQAWNFTYLKNFQVT